MVFKVKLAEILQNSGNRAEELGSNVITYNPLGNDNIRAYTTTRRREMIRWRRSGCDEADAQKRMRGSGCAEVAKASVQSSRVQR